jgi:hypothetical protein
MIALGGYRALPGGWLWSDSTPRHHYRPDAPVSICGRKRRPGGGLYRLQVPSSACYYCLVRVRREASR